MNTKKTGSRLFSGAMTSINALLKDAAERVADGLVPLKNIELRALRFLPSSLAFRELVLHLLSDEAAYPLFAELAKLAEYMHPTSIHFFGILSLMHLVTESQDGVPKVFLGTTPTTIGDRQAVWNIVIDAALKDGTVFECLEAFAEGDMGSAKEIAEALAALRNDPTITADLFLSKLAGEGSE